MNLQAWLKQKHTLPEQLKVMDGVCTALNDLHARGVVHGDLSLDTVEVGGDGMGALGSPDMGGSLGLGSRSGPYLAPEVAQGGAASPKADIFAAGIIFYQILAGSAPAEGQQPLHEKRRDIPRDLADAVNACMETDPNWRPGDLTYLLELVRKLRGPEAAAARPAPARVAEAPRAKSATSATPKVAPAAAKGGGPPIAAIAVVVVLLAGGGGFFWMQSQKKKPAPPPVAPSEAPVTTTTLVAESMPPSEAPTSTVAAKPKPSPSTHASAEPSAPPSPKAGSRPSPVAATPEPRATPTAAPTPAPVAATPAPVAERIEPPELKTISPPSIKGPGVTILDVRGKGLHPSHQAHVLKAGKPATGISVLRQRFKTDSLVEVVIKVEDASPGTYALVMSDPEGRTSNFVPFQLTR